MRALERTSVVVRLETVLTADVAGEAVMMNTATNAYYDTDAIGARIWALIETARSVDEVVGWLVERYEVDRDQCEKDVMAFLEEVLAEGLIRVTPSAEA